MKTHHILLVEDSKGDVRLTMEALKDSRIPNQLHVVNDGVEAIEFLNKSGPYTNVPVPELILLDLNLPRKNGFEVLKEIKESKKLRTIPIVILSTSDSPADIVRSYELYVNCFVSKPVEFDGFTKAIRSIEDFWFTTVNLPSSLQV